MSRFKYEIVVAFLAVVIACKDTGVPPPLQPAINSMVPDSAAVGDTVRILGENFGAVRGASSVRIGSVGFALIVSWSETEIRARVPIGAFSSNVVVTVNGAASNPHPYIIKGSTPGLVSFAGDVQPILNSSCALSGCHVPPTPASSFDQTTWAGVRAGGFYYFADAAKAGDSTNSGYRIVLRDLPASVRPPRMPYGGAALPDAQITTILTWVQQGSLNN